MHYEKWRWTRDSSLSFSDVWLIFHLQEVLHEYPSLSVNKHENINKKHCNTLLWYSKCFTKTIWGNRLNRRLLFKVQLISSVTSWSEITLRFAKIQILFPKCILLSCFSIQLPANNLWCSRLIMKFGKGFHLNAQFCP